MKETTGPPGSTRVLHVSKHRLEALTDGLFAIVMTLLVLELRIQDLPRTASVPELAGSLARNIPVFFSLLITFMFAALFWYLHHALLNLLRELPGPLLVLNLAFLLFASLLPFSVGLLGHFIHNPLAQTLYFGNQFAISVLLLLMWLMASQRNLIEQAKSRDVRKFGIRVTALPIAAALAIAFAWVNPKYSFYVFVAVMVASRAYSTRVYGRG